MTQEKEPASSTMPCDPSNENTYQRTYEPLTEEQWDSVWTEFKELVKAGVIKNTQFTIHDPPNTDEK